jgi:IS5 family transposase
MSSYGRAHALRPSSARSLPVADAVVQAAVALGLEDGARLRVDTTMVETDIHWPTDSGLLWDAVRVLARLVKRLASRSRRRGGGLRTAPVGRVGGCRNSTG